MFTPFLPFSCLGENSSTRWQQRFVHHYLPEGTTLGELVVCRSDGVWLLGVRLHRRWRWRHDLLCGAVSSRGCLPN